MSDDDLPPCTTEEYARANPAAFAEAMGDYWLAAILRGERPPRLLADLILEKPAEED